MARFDHLELGGPTPHDRPRPLAASEIEQPRDERHWLALAEQNRRQGFYETALRFYSRALEIDKTLIAGWLGQVQMLVLLEEHPEADLWARKALELFRSNGELLAARAQALCRLGDFKQALGLCDSSLAQEGQSAYRWLVRGELMVARRQGTDQHLFDKAVQTDSDWLVPLEAAGIYLYYGNPSKGLQRVMQALAKAPDSPHCWRMKARCEQELGLDGPAEESLQRCLDLAPGHVEAERELVALRQRGWSLLGWLRRLLRRS